MILDPKPVLDHDPETDTWSLTVYASGMTIDQVCDVINIAEHHSLVQACNAAPDRSAAIEIYKDAMKMPRLESAHWVHRNTRHNEQEPANPGRQLLGVPSPLGRLMALIGAVRAGRDA